MSTERTLVLVKPDGVQRGLSGAIISRLEARGLRIVGMKMLQVSRDMAMQHYGAHEGKPFFAGLVSFITSGPVVAMALEGPSAIEMVRATMGVTNPLQGFARHHPRRFRRGHRPQPGSRLGLAGERGPGARVVLLGGRDPELSAGRGRLDH